MSTVEANLDDFFKKRDKKKKSSKNTKFSKIDNAELASHLDAVSSNNLVLNDEEQQQAFESDSTAPVVALPINSVPIAAVSAKDDSLANTNTVNGKSNNDDGDDEWRQFDSDENKNYSGLKINFLR